MLCLVQSLTHSLTHLLNDSYLQRLSVALYLTTVKFSYGDLGEFDVRAENADCEGWMRAVKALTPKIATEHLMVNALLGFEIVAQA